MTLDERKALSLPYTVRSDGRRQYSRCFMYDVNYTSIIEEWLHQVNYLANDGISTAKFPTPVSSVDWPITKCLYGWNYDRRDYDSTLVTEVNSLFLFYYQLSNYRCHN